MSSRIISFDNLSKSNFPASIIFDTNFVLNLTHAYTNHPTSQNALVCKIFMTSLVYDHCEIFIPHIVINEFCHQIYLDVISEYQHKRNSKGDKIALYKWKPNLIAPGHHKIKAAIKAMDDCVSKREINEDGLAVRDRALALMRKYHFLPSDAFIAAIAIENKIDHIATLDHYFARRICEQYLTVFMPKELYGRI